MLPLPKGLDIERDLDEEKDLLLRARDYLERRERVGIHASDLIDERLAFWKKVDPRPLPDRLVNMFIVGMVAHAIIEVVKGAEGDYTKSDGGTKYFEDIHYSPDFMNFKGEPDEIKTTRSFYLPKAAYLPDDSTFHRYLEQLMVYMAAEDKTTGRLTILYMNSKGEDNRTFPMFYVWKITTTPEALKAYRKLIVKKKDKLANAIEKKDCSELSLCRDFMCSDCEYWEQCKPSGRYEFGRKSKKEWTA